MSIATATTMRQVRTQPLKFRARPQRRRLLHVYPLAAAMTYTTQELRSRTANGDAGFVLLRLDRFLPSRKRTKTTIYKQSKR